MFRLTLTAAALLFAAIVSGQAADSSSGPAMKGSFKVEDGRATFELGFPGQKQTVAIEARTKDVQQIDGGWKAAGDLTLVTQLGPLKLLQADLLFERASDGSIARLRGRCAVPPPFVSDRVRVASPAMAEIGCDLGSRIHLGVPLDPDRTYLFFRFEAGFGIEIATGDDPEATAPIKVGIPAGIDGTLIIDPNDPFYFLGGAFMPEDKKDTSKEDGDGDDASQGDGPDKDRSDGGSKESDGTQDDSAGDNVPKDESSADDNEEEAEAGSVTTGEGSSKTGLIPFTPQNVYGIEQQVEGFSGQKVKTGSFPLGQLPVVVEGHMVTRFDTNAEDGFDPLGVGIAPAYRAGANGDLLVAFPLAKITGLGALVEFGFGLGTATAGLEVSGERQVAYFSGEIDPDLSWLPNATPFRPQGNARFTGFLSSDLTESHLAGEGEVGVDVSFFTRLAGLEMGENVSVEGALRADKNGIAVRAKTQAPVGPVVPKGDVELTAHYGAPASTMLRLAGSFEVARGEVDGEVTFDAAGARIEGTLRGEVELQLVGQIEHRESGLVLAAEVVPSSEFQEALASQAKVAAKSHRERADAALSSLQAATKNYEVELSLRGMRKLIPTLCSRAIGEIKGIPGKIKKQWPKKFGRELPGRKTATRSAEKDAKPTIDRLKRLSAAAKGGSDARFRSELKAAAENLIKHRRLKIKVKVVGTVYNKDVISKSQVAQLRKAIAAVDALPAASERKVSAQKICDAVPVSAILDQVQADIEKGLDSNLPTVESIAVILPLHETTEPCEATARIRMGEDVQEVTATFLPANSASFPGAVAEAWVRSVTAGE